jgi:hypothetical protein
MHGTDVLAKWGTQSYFEARARAWTFRLFRGKLEVPILTADNGDFRQERLSMPLF